VLGVGDDGTAPSWSGQEWWSRVLQHPEVERVDVDSTVVRVRLRSGVELEWPRDAGTSKVFPLRR
jgi:hypothetical protein